MTLQYQIITFFLAILIGAMALSGVVQYIAERDEHLESFYNQMNAISEAKRLRLEGIIRKREEQVIMLQLREHIRNNFVAYQETGDPARLPVLIKSLRESRDNIPSFKELHLLTLQGKVVASSAPDEYIGMDFSDRMSFRHAMAGEHCMHEFFEDKNRELSINLGGKLIHNNKEIGVIIVTTNAEDVLSIINDYTGLGETGETTLARKDSSGNVVYLTPTRFYNKPGDFLVVAADSNKAMTLALSGVEELHTDLLDYRNQRVIAAPRYIKGTGWGLTTKIDRKEALQPLRELLLRTLLLTLFLSLLVSVGAYYFARRVLRPINILCKISWEIAHGKVEKRINYISKNEVGHLAENFNLMADRLVETNKALSEKIEELDRINDSLNRFSYVVSHDLKSPLAALESLMLHIRDDVQADDKMEVEKMLGMAEERVKHMQGLINGILAYSQAGAAKKELEKVDLQQLVEEVVQQLPVPEHVTIEVKELPVITSEKVPIVQVFQNLIGNAVKFMDKPVGKIMVSSHSGNGQYRFQVRDNGSGIEEKQFEKIFNLFNKVNQVKGVDSTGVGLSIVKKIVEGMGGRVWVESEVGKGSCFYFTIPVRQP